VRSVAFSLQFRGHSNFLVPGVLTARATAPSGGLVTRIDADGVHGSFEPVEGQEALLERRLTLLDETHFEDAGTISFGNGNALRFRSVGQGTLVPSPEPELRQGAAVTEIDGGVGAFATARGRIVSNFLVSENGELTDHQIGVLFVEPSMSSAVEHAREGVAPEST
jgi:hypothetical protein